jgi:energy-coupling factor transporter transmembrane protein EcfT
MISCPGYYVPSESPVHSLDPRVKLIVAVSLCMIVLQTTPFFLSAICIFLAVMIFLARLSFKSVLLALKPALPMPILILLLHLFFTGGTPIPPFPVLHISITDQGLATGALLVYRFLLLYSSAILLTMVTLPSEIIRGLEKLLKPLELIRIPTSDLALMLSIALRFIPIIYQEFTTIREAQAARGANYQVGDLLQRIRAVTTLAMPLTVNTCGRAEELTAAMEARGYRGGPRTYLSELTMKPADYLIVALAIVAAGCLLR